MLRRPCRKVAKVVLATGVWMGGTQAYVWGLMHPEMVDAVMPIGGAHRRRGAGRHWTFQMVKAAMESDPVWQATGGDYYKLPKEKHPVPGVAFGWSVLGLTGYDVAFRSSQASTRCSRKCSIGIRRMRRPG